jgi:nucleotide-binding universal stress UspA family protein
MPTVPQVSRLSLKKILFPTDFSEASRHALPFAQTLARIYESTLLVAHAIPPEPHQAVPMDRLPEQDDLVWENARREIERFAHDPSFAGRSWKPVLERGDLADVVPAMIQEHHVDLIVLGTHGHRGVTRMLLGSGAEKIYRSAACPVLTIGPKVQATGEWKLRRILCPIDAAEDPDVALRYALSLAEENQSELIIVEAIPLVPWQHRAVVDFKARRALEALIPEHAKDWCTPEFVIRWEHPAEAILQEALHGAVDLIVMAVHRSHATGLTSHLPWPIASEVVSRALCPVLTLRV